MIESDSTGRSLKSFHIPHWPVVLEEIFGLLIPFANSLPQTTTELATRCGWPLKKVEDTLLAIESKSQDIEISCEELYTRLERETLLLVDVREDWEFQTAHLESSLLLSSADPETLLASFEKFPAVIMICHHGVRSFSAAMYFRSLGKVNVFSLAGGLDKWATAIDQSMPRY